MGTADVLSERLETKKWYHVRILGKPDADGVAPILHLFDLSESGLKTGITIPYGKGKKFLFGDSFVDPSYITDIRIVSTPARVSYYLKDQAFVRPRDDIRLFEFLAQSQQGDDVTFDFI